MNCLPLILNTLLHSKEWYHHTYSKHSKFDALPPLCTPLNTITRHGNAVTCLSISTCPSTSLSKRVRAGFPRWRPYSQCVVGYCSGVTLWQPQSAGSVMWNEASSPVWYRPVDPTLRSLDHLGSSLSYTPQRAGRGLGLMHMSQTVHCYCLQLYLFYCFLCTYTLRYDQDTKTECENTTL